MLEGENKEHFDYFVCGDQGGGMFGRLKVIIVTDNGVEVHANVCS